MKIAICEDNNVDATIVETHIKKWSRLTGDDINVTHFSNAEQLLFQFPDDSSFDIIFIDVQLKNMDGIELSRRIRMFDKVVSIVFITALKEHAILGYDVSALHYLIKPAKENDICDCLDKCKVLIASESKMASILVINKGKTSVAIKHSEILYCIMFDHYIDVHTETGCFSYRTPISKIEALLPINQFVRCHRSYIVNLKKVRMVIDDCILLDNGVKIPIAKKNIEKINNAFVSFYR